MKTDWNRNFLKRSSEKSGLLVLLMAVILLTPSLVFSFQFKSGDFNGALDTTLSYGMAWRMADQDAQLIGTANGGTAYSVNGDDGNLNYDKGDLISNAAKITSDLAMNYKSFGLFVRGTAFYDWENQEGDRARTPLTDEALDMVGTDIELLDAYLTADFDLGTMPVQIRAGNQVISWGESTFIQGGINTINPVDVSKIRVPGAELKEALIPVGIISTSLSPTENFTFEGFYQYDWKETKIDPPGSYWSTNDFAGEGGRKVMLGWGDVSDLGTTNPMFPLFGLNLFEPDFLGVTRLATDEPDDNGQYGLALRALASGLNETEFGFYFINYHSRLPIISARTGTATGVATAVGVLTAGGLPAAAIAVHQYAKTANYFLEYPEDIKLYGVSFNTLINATGTAIQGEYSYRQDVPLQIDDVEILIAALSPLEATAFGPALPYQNNQLGLYGTDSIINGYMKLDISQIQLTATQIFGPTAGADQFVLVGEAGLTYVHDMPSKDVLRFESAGTYVTGEPTNALATGAHPGKAAEPASAFADDTSWGYRLVTRFDFNNAIGAVTLSPRVAWAHDVDGNSPGPGGNFLEGRKAVTVGLGANYMNTWTADLSYTDFFGAGRYNLINDRDFLAFNVKYSF